MVCPELVAGWINRVAACRHKFFAYGFDVSHLAVLVAGSLSKIVSFVFGDADLRRSDGIANVMLEIFIVEVTSQYSPDVAIL